MNLETLKTIINSFGVASSDATMNHLNHVKIEAVRINWVKVTATNGHALSQVELEDITLYNAIIDVGAPVFIHRDKLAVLKVQAKEKLHTLPIFPAEKGFIVGFVDGIQVTYKTAAGLNFTYPNIDAVIPKNIDQYTISFGVNPELLVDVLNSIKLERKQVGLKIKLNPNDLRCPILVELSDTQTGIVMPMRL